MDASTEQNSRQDMSAVDERRPLLDEQSVAHGKQPEQDSEVQVYGTAQSSLCSKQEEDPPLKPWGPLIVILAISAVQPLCFELIFPFVSASKSPISSQNRKLSHSRRRPNGA